MVGENLNITTNGVAESVGALDATGLMLGFGSDATIGGAGNISGLGVIGTLNASGNLGDQVQITAATTDGIANTRSRFGATGISGMNGMGMGDSTITAGPNDGDVRGQVLAGGQVGTNSVIGTTLGDFDATASSVKGDSDAFSNVSAFGIVSTATADTTTASSVSGNAIGNGSLNATAQSNSQSLASSVGGRASA